ncbi:acetyltransferase [Bosea thiooxidans]|uniref:Acetyltransferase n=1 Tax=Bosea thiooxidans TaxID=53254 RepID=A0A0Q3SQR2_9HYPH|nr:GNAT family N-acetyltransferase [Bosea thiooxidans]KQK27802.1 acetyltransferase [Bosea thiooxidans]
MSQHTVPTLQTQRLNLRPMAEADFPAYAAFLASPRAAGLGGPLSQRQAWGLFCHDIACWPLFGHGGLMIDRRADGTCVGQVGISHGPLFPEKELGWLLYEGHEGHGYATEAAIALRDWAARALGVSELVSYIAPNNAASAAVAERLGAVRDLLADRPDPNDLVYRHRLTTAPR